MHLLHNNLVTHYYLPQRNPRLFGIVIDENFRNTANSEIKILEVKIKDLQIAGTAAKKANCSQKASKSVSVTIPVNNPIHVEIVAKNTPLAVLKNLVSIEFKFIKIV